LFFGEEKRLPRTEGKGDRSKRRGKKDLSKKGREGDMGRRTSNVEKRLGRGTLGLQQEKKTPKDNKREIVRSEIELKKRGEEKGGGVDKEKKKVFLMRGHSLVAVFRGAVPYPRKKDLYDT